MFFSNWFNSQLNADTASTNTNPTGTKKIIDSLMPHPTNNSPFSFPIEEPLEIIEMSPDLHTIPLEKRIALIIAGDTYQQIYNRMLESKIRQIKKRHLEEIKKDHPELSGKIGPKNIRFEAGSLENIKDHLSGTFINAVFTKKEIKTAVSHLLDPKTTFQETDKSVLKACMWLWRHNPEFMVKVYGVKTGVLQSLIARGETDLANFIGEALEEDPRAVIGCAHMCCKKIEGYDRGKMALTADRWAAQWLNPKMLKTLIQSRPLMPTIGSKTDKPTREDIARAQRYQSGFKSALLYYFFKSPTSAQHVFEKVFSHISRTDQVMQEQMWGILFQKYKADSSIRNDVVGYMSTFLSQGDNREAQKTMYGMFIKTLSPQLRADILGHMPFRALKRYWNIFTPTHKQIPYASIQEEGEQTYFAWYLFHEREISDDQMKTLLKNTNPKVHRDFLFSAKKVMDRDLFRYGADMFSGSPFYFWQWVRSFQHTDNFSQTLADIYPTLPPSVRENKAYISAFNNHYGLIRKCAQNGDTGSLSALKKILGSEVFWNSMMQESKGSISGLRSLCHQGKRGLLKLISDWPIQKQQDLFMSTDSSGRTLLDDCTGNFARLVSQNVFSQTYQKPSKPVEQSDKASDTSIETTSQRPQKKNIQRQIIRLPAFEGHMARIATNTKLVQEVEDTIITLSKMNKAEIAMEIRGGLKHHGTLGNARCIVKDIRGNNYRLGYILSGDTDLGTGQIAVLFFLTHAQYDIFLNKQADQAVRTARAMMTIARQPLTVPTDPAGGNERQ